MNIDYSQQNKSYADFYEVLSKTDTIFKCIDNYENIVISTFGYCSGLSKYCGAALVEYIGKKFDNCVVLVQITGSEEEALLKRKYPNVKILYADPILLAQHGWSSYGSFYFNKKRKCKKIK